jgi:alpha-mannosidase
MSSEGGFELGVPRRLRYALYPHEGAWADALVHREAQALNHPVIVRKVAAHPGALPKRWGLVEVSSPRLVIAAIQPGRDGRTLVRLYEATGQPVADATVRFATGVNAAHTANLLGDPGDALAVEADAVRLDFRPFEIRTIAVELAPPDA